METKYRYVWLDMNTGKFSNSWNEDLHKYVDEKMVEDHKKSGWKLIKYECLNDEDFEFYNRMQLR